MDSATNWVQSHASTAAITLGVLVVLVMSVNLTSILLRSYLRARRKW